MTDRENRDVLKCLERTPKKEATERREALRKEENSGGGSCRRALALTVNEDDDLSADGAEFPSIHPVYHAISLLNGLVNRMDLGQLKSKCREEELDTFGKREAVKRRLKEHYKVKKLCEAGLLDRKVNRNVDYFIVIDFEATCEMRNPPNYAHEIIEFPAVLVSSAEPVEIVDVFHAYCRPVVNPILSEFCKTLTGIEQKTVDAAETFPVVHARFLKWLTEKHRLGVESSFAVVTDGPFDMGRFLLLQVEQCQMEFPDYAKVWINLRKSFANFYKRDFYSHSSTTVKLPGLQTMLALLDMEFEGQPHCGLDDAKNIGRVLIRLIKDGAIVRINEKILPRHTALDDSREPGVRLKCVMSVARKEAEAWYKAQKLNSKSKTYSSHASFGEE